MKRFLRLGDCQHLFHLAQRETLAMTVQPRDASIGKEDARRLGAEAVSTPRKPT